MGISTEISILKQGLQQKWDIPITARQKAVSRIAGMLDSNDPAEVRDATKILVSMDKVNVAHERNNAAKLHINTNEMSDTELFARLKALSESSPELRTRLLDMT